MPRRLWDPWYFDIPAISQLATEPLVLDTPVTVIVGENGSGKSTLLEAVAAAWSARLRGAVKHWTPRAGDEDSDLHWAVRLEGEFPPPAGGCFLRAEAMHQLFTEVDGNTPHQVFGGALNARSHGESFGVPVVAGHRTRPVHPRRARGRAVVPVMPATDGADGLARRRRLAGFAGHPLTGARGLSRRDDSRVRRPRPPRMHMGRPADGVALAPFPGRAGCVSAAPLRLRLDIPSAQVVKRPLRWGCFGGATMLSARRMRCGGAGSRGGCPRDGFPARVGLGGEGRRQRGAGRSRRVLRGCG